MALRMGMARPRVDLGDLEVLMVEGMVHLEAVQVDTVETSSETALVGTMTGNQNGQDIRLVGLMVPGDGISRPVLMGVCECPHRSLSFSFSSLFMLLSSRVSMIVAALGSFPLMRARQVLCMNYFTSQLRHRGRPRLED
jgi:hypothetical protein